MAWSGEYKKNYHRNYYLRHRVLRVGKKSPPKEPINCSICSISFYRTNASQKVCFSCKPKNDYKRRLNWFKNKYNTDDIFRKNVRALNNKNRAVWLEKNIDKERKRKRIYQNNRRAIGIIDRKIFQMVYEDNIKKYGTLTCILCLKNIGFGEDSLEHKIPISRGGTNEYENLAISHLICNIRKHTKTVEEYLESQNR